MFQPFTAIRFFSIYQINTTTTNYNLEYNQIFTFVR